MISGGGGAAKDIGVKGRNVKFNWDQKGMPVALVNRLGQRNEFAEFKTVLNDARNQILQPVDAETMARELAESGGREFVEMVRELSTALSNAQRELESANRRYERLVADLARRGIRMDGNGAARRKSADSVGTADAAAARNDEPPSGGLSEWDEWNRKFQSLLD